MASTNGTNAAAVVTSATYNFVAGDVGDYVWIPLVATGFIIGLYKIASVASNAATLTKACGTAATCSGGSATIDRSQDTTAKFAFDGSTIAATGTNGSAVITLTGVATDASDVGNLLNITGGTNFTTGVYQVISVVVGVAGVGTWTLDRSCATGVATGMTGNMGGCFASISKAAGVAVSQNRTYVKNGAGGSASGSTNITSGITFGAANSAWNSTTPPNRLIGYTTTRGDGGQTAFTISGSSITALTFTNNGWLVEGLNINCNNQTTSTGIKFNGTSCVIRNCKISNFSVRGALLGGTVQAAYCEVNGGTSGSTAALDNNGSTTSQLCFNYLHDNLCPAINVGAGSAILFNVASNNTGANVHAVKYGNTSVIMFNTIYNSGGDALHDTATVWGVELIRNNIIAQSGGYHLNGSTSAGNPADPSYDGNLFGSSNASEGATSGNRNNSDDLSTNLIDAISPYTNTLDVLATAELFTAKASNDFSLNTTAGGGAVARSVAYPGVGGTLFSGWPGLGSTTGYPDFGAIRHQDPASTGGGAQVIGC